MAKGKTKSEIAILVVDDVESNLVYLEELILLRYSVTVLKASSGVEAFKVLEKHEVALVILDVMMPKMDGFEVLSRIKKMEEIKDIPVILISALGEDVKDIEKGISYGAVDFVTKPINHEILLGKINVFINLFQQRKNLSNLISQLEKVNLRLTESEKRFKKLSLAAVDAIIIVDYSNRITFWNLSAQKIFGYRKEEIINEPISTIIRFPDYFRIDTNSIPKLFEMGILKVSNKVYEMEGIRNNDLLISLELTFSVFSVNLDKHGVIIARDITRRKRLERELLKTKELRESNKTMKRFIDNINHELLTPVNIIKGLSSGLLSYNTENLTEKQAEAISHIKENSLRLNILLENLLAYKQPVASKTSTIQLKKLADRIMNYVNNKLNNKNVSFEITLNEGAPEIFYSDRQKVEHILINLVENSIKFTEKGQILLDVNSNGDYIVFQLTDTGIGIDEKDLRSITRKFHQLDNSTVRKYGGLGLGLTVINKYVKQMDGKLEIESKKNAGTKITVLIPNIDHA